MRMTNDFNGPSRLHTGGVAGSIPAAPTSQAVDITAERALRAARTLGGKHAFERVSRMNMHGTRGKGGATVPGLFPTLYAATPETSHDRRR